MALAPTSLPRERLHVAAPNDPKSRQDLLAALRADVRDRGVCVLWATHRVEEAEAADRVLVLHKGTLLADGTPAQVTGVLGEATLEAGFIARTS